MNIPSETVLIKMEQLVAQAKQAETEDKLKGCIMAIQALCDLLSTPSQKSGAMPSAVRTPIAPAPQPDAAVYTQPQPASIQPVPVKMDEANGDSLLDF